MPNVSPGVGVLSSIWAIVKPSSLFTKSISSRAHKLNSITEATNLNYLIKEISNSDQRKKYLKPSPALKEEFEKYLDEII